jgi:hypothetical protein
MQHGRPAASCFACLAKGLPLSASVGLSLTITREVFKLSYLSWDVNEICILPAVSGLVCPSSIPLIINGGKEVKTYR